MGVVAPRVSLLEGVAVLTFKSSLKQNWFRIHSDWTSGIKFISNDLLHGLENLFQLHFVHDDAGIEGFGRV